MNIAIEKMDIRSVAETVDAERLLVKIAVVHEVDAQVARVAGINNGLNWVDGLAMIDDGLDWVDRVARIANRVDIYRVIGYL